MESNFKEYENKYSANEIKLTDFKALVESFKPVKFIETSSYDLYFTNKKHEFIRYRKSKDRPEATIKQKVTELYNIDRVEVNLPLDKDRITDQTVEAFVDLLGYKKNFTIFKSCWIYYFDSVDLVYYVVFDENMKELDRYIEIECLEEKSLTKEQAFDILKKYETMLEPLGISSNKRLKQSLFERYSK
jgi:hypothetical protein